MYFITWAIEFTDIRFWVVPLVSQYAFCHICFESLFWVTIVSLLLVLSMKFSMCMCIYYTEMNEREKKSQLCFSAVRFSKHFRITMSREDFTITIDHIEFYQWYEFYIYEWRFLRQTSRNVQQSVEIICLPFKISHFKWDVMIKVNPKFWYNRFYSTKRNVRSLLSWVVFLWFCLVCVESIGAWNSSCHFI